MTLTQIKYFVKTAETCNFTQAASELYITQQVLSKQIQALEKEIGFALFSRENRRRVELTEAGALMFDTWKPLLEQTEDALARGVALSQKKTLRFGVPSISQVLEIAMRVAQDYIASQEQYEVEFVVESSKKIRWMFEKRELDLLIAFSVNTTELQEAFCCERLKRMEFGVICSKRHPLAKKGLLTAKDLDRQLVCMFKESYAKNIEKNVLNIFYQAGIRPREVKRYESWQNMALALEMGKGINLGFRDFVEEGRGLVYIPIDKDLLKEDIWLMVFSKDQRTKEFVEKLKKEYP